MEDLKTNPILFSTPMVHAIQEALKWQTRRDKGLEIINQNPDAWEFRPNAIIVNGKPNEWVFLNRTAAEHLVVNSTYQVGDILWVRETWQYSDDLDNPYLYKQKFEDEYRPEYHKDMKWKPSIFMPKEAARIFLKVTNVRVERLNEISGADAVAEGVRSRLPDNGIAQSEFIELWESINGRGSWNKNPFVWVYDFKVFDTNALKED